jgi:inosine-uridine nucleoside N-ribohydrolase
MQRVVLCDEMIVRRLTEPAGPVRAVLDTDTYNEIDDQFALVWATLSPRVELEAIYAAPFHNKRSDGPGDGMERSYAEICRLLDRLGGQPAGGVFRGSGQFMPTAGEPVASPAAEDLIARAHAQGDAPLYVLTIGAPTNVASAILLAPSIAEKIVVVWLGGHAHHWHTTGEFNCRQDPHATRVLLDSGVPLVQAPCIGAADMLTTTRAEMERYVRGRGAIGDYLFEIFAEFVEDRPGRSKVIWDLASVAWVVNPAWTPSVLVASPILTDQMTWSFDAARHPIRVMRQVRRDAIFGDLFSLLAGGKSG